MFVRANTSGLAPTGAVAVGLPSGSGGSMSKERQGSPLLSRQWGGQEARMLVREHILRKYAARPGYLGSNSRPKRTM
jgi:hypothetical protein